VTLLLAARSEELDSAWSAFLHAYSRVLLKAASAYASGYDDMLDRYAYILDELRRHDCRRLRRYAADGRCRFSTWLLVVAKRLSVDHHRSRYGRTLRNGCPGAAPSVARVARRGLGDLANAVRSLECIEDPAFVDPLDALDASDRLAALQRALANLAPEDRRLLDLRYDRSLSAREIARILGLPSPFHVYRRVNAVCARLRCELAGLAVAMGDERRPLLYGPGMTPATRCPR
jgi:RNA polymerase sigma factor (sigma-70 family)